MGIVSAVLTGAVIGVSSTFLLLLFLSAPTVGCILVIFGFLFLQRRKGV